MFHSFHRLVNSKNWPASSVWVFIAQLGEHCSANAEATGSNPIEGPKIFFSGYFRNCLNCDSLRWSHTHFICIPAVHIISFNVSLSTKTFHRRIGLALRCRPILFITRRMITGRIGLHSVLLPSFQNSVKIRELISVPVK